MRLRGSLVPLLLPPGRSGGLPWTIFRSTVGSTLLPQTYGGFLRIFLCSSFDGFAFIRHSVYGVCRLTVGSAPLSARSFCVPFFCAFVMAVAYDRVPPRAVDGGHRGTSKNITLSLEWEQSGEQQPPRLLLHRSSWNPRNLCLHPLCGAPVRPPRKDIKAHEVPIDPQHAQLQ